jgi:hypothetical protein
MVLFARELDIPDNGVSPIGFCTLLCDSSKHHRIETIRQELLRIQDGVTAHLDSLASEAYYRTPEGIILPR